MRSRVAALAAAVVLALGSGGGASAFAPAARFHATLPPARTGRALAPAASRRCASAGAAAGGARMQVAQGNWVDTVAAQQQRDPARLAPLKPLPDVIRIRMPEVTPSTERASRRLVDGAAPRLPLTVPPRAAPAAAVARKRSMAPPSSRSRPASWACSSGSILGTTVRT